MNKLNKFISLNFNKILTFILIFNPIIDLLNSIFINNLHLNFTFGVVVRIIFLLFFIYCLLNLKETNKKIKEICKEKNITYVNVYDELTDKNGNLKLEYTVEGLHISDEGYKKITNVLSKYVN